MWPLLPAWSTTIRYYNRLANWRWKKILNISTYLKEIRQSAVKLWPKSYFQYCTLPLSVMLNFWKLEFGHNFLMSLKQISSKLFDFTKMWQTDQRYRCYFCNPQKHTLVARTHALNYFAYIIVLGNSHIFYVMP